MPKPYALGTAPTAIYNHIGSMIQLLLRGGSTPPMPLKLKGSPKVGYKGKLGAPLNLCPGV